MITIYAPPGCGIYSQLSEHLPSALAQQICLAPIEQLDVQLLDVFVTDVAKDAYGFTAVHAFKRSAGVYVATPDIRQVGIVLRYLEHSLELGVSLAMATSSCLSHSHLASAELQAAA